MNENIKIGFVSLGCSKNLIDTEIMLAHLVKEGYEIVESDADAYIMIINTCGFIESAKKEAIENILDVAWLKSNHTLKGIIVCGCLTERYREEVMNEIPEIDAILGVGSIHDIVDAVKAVAKGEKYSSFKDKNSHEIGGDRVVTTPPYTTYIKIAEGCNNRCAFCAIPSIRGKFRSRKIEDIIKEAKEMEELGAKEINIIAQDITRYGEDIYGEYSLAKLLREMTAQTSVAKFRLLYCYPDKITDELVDEIANNDRVLKYIDIPIQHISDPVLKRMNRHGDSAQIKSVIKNLRKKIPGICIRTTVMVGFPGETEEDFIKLCEFIKEEKFDRLGAFTFSPEENTPAYSMDGQIDEETKQKRYDIIMRSQMHINSWKNKQFINKTVEALVEDWDPVSEMYFGRTYRDAPDIDTKIYFKNAPGARRLRGGDIVKVHIDEVLDYDLMGEVVQ